MRTLEMYRAQDLGSKPVEPLSIHIEQPFPRHVDSRTASELHDEQARALCNNLGAVLPQGTLERLLGHLLMALACDYIGPMKGPAPTAAEGAIPPLLTEKDTP